MQVNISDEGAAMLLSITQAQAPNEYWRKELADDYAEVLAESGTERAIVMLLDTLSDGIKYGNWPWAERGDNLPARTRPRPRRPVKKGKSA